MSDEENLREGASHARDSRRRLLSASPLNWIYALAARTDAEAAAARTNDPYLARALRRAARAIQRDADDTAGT